MRVGMASSMRLARWREGRQQMRSFEARMAPHRHIQPTSVAGADAASDVDARRRRADAHPDARPVRIVVVTLSSLAPCKVPPCSRLSTDRPRHPRRRRLEHVRLRDVRLRVAAGAQLTAAARGSM